MPNNLILWRWSKSHGLANDVSTGEFIVLSGFEGDKDNFTYKSEIRIRNPLKAYQTYRDAISAIYDKSFRNQLEKEGYNPFTGEREV